MTFKLTRLSFIIVISSLGLANLFFELSPIWLLLPCAAFLGLIIYGSACIQSNFFTPVYCHKETTEKHIALTFDDGPSHHFTPQVLSILAEYNAQATFFVIGKNIWGNEGILKQIDAAGHSIGNHSHTHSSFIDFKNAQGFMDELKQTADKVFNVIGKRMRLFRPPYGVITPNIVKAVKALDYQIIGWSIRSFDTTADSAQSIVQRVQAQIKPGAIILFHDRSDKTLEALKQTLDFAKNNDYKVVGIEQLLKINAYM